MAERTTQTGLREAVERWTAAPPERMHLILSRAPSAAERHWVRALRRAGTPVTWSNDGIPPLAIEAAPVVDPRGGAMIWLVAAPDHRVVLSDAITALDSVVAHGGGAMVKAPIAVSPFEARVGDHTATTAVRDTGVARRVLVIGEATWEAKFVITALEEAGWLVDARLALAPGLAVVQGASGPPDTARHAAVVMLGIPEPSVGAAATRYVRDGGGLILAGGSAESRSLAALTAGRFAPRTRPATSTFVADAPRRALAFRGIALRSDALVLEEQGAHAVVAARRFESGRVVQVGYEETWRWRLAGGPNAVETHRDWWSGLVSAVAYRAVVASSKGAPNDPAPLAALVAALGPPAPGATLASGDARWRPSPTLLFSIIVVLLLAEIASRRLRGAP